MQKDRTQSGADLFPEGLKPVGEPTLQQRKSLREKQQERNSCVLTINGCPSSVHYTGWVEESIVKLSLEKGG